MPVPDSLQERRDLFRALMSVRSPMPISEEFLRVQDEELQALLAGKGVVEIAGQAGNDGIEDYRERVSKAGGQMTSC